MYQVTVVDKVAWQMSVCLDASKSPYPVLLIFIHYRFRGIEIRQADVDRDFVMEPTKGRDPIGLKRCDDEDAECYVGLARTLYPRSTNHDCLM